MLIPARAGMLLSRAGEDLAALLTMGDQGGDLERGDAEVSRQAPPSPEAPGSGTSSGHDHGLRPAIRSGTRQVPE